MNMVAPLGTIMGVWAHPDDESFMTGGLLHAAAKNGQQVICITATKGEAGVQDESRWPADKLGEIRAKELQSALEILGIQEQQWLGYYDGRCSDIPDEEAIKRLVSLIEQYKPDTIVTFPPDGLTGHPDHQAVSRWARAAAARAVHQPAVYFAVQTQEAYDSFLQVMDEKFNVYFATDHPVFVPEAQCDILLKLSPEVAQTKAKALKAQQSQFSAMFDFLGDKGVEFAVGVEGLVKAENTSFWSK